MEIILELQQLRSEKRAMMPVFIHKRPVINVHFHPAYHYLFVILIRI